MREKWDDLNEERSVSWEFSESSGYVTRRKREPADHVSFSHIGKAISSSKINISVTRFKF